MKSFVAYPVEFEKMLFPQAHNGAGVGKIIAHYELYKKVKHLDGSVIKCGISADEGFTRFAMFKSLMPNLSAKQMIAFEKLPEDEFARENIFVNEPYRGGQQSMSINNVQQTLIQKGINEEVTFVPGNVYDSIPNYLIENPELKISFLNIDLDSYESTLTALEYFYPRLVEGGIMVSDNYFKNDDERRAIETYFTNSSAVINNFAVTKGPHYIVRQ